MTKELLLPLADGGIENIISDTYACGGCETCDYGSSYTNEYTIVLTSGRLYIEASMMYEYPLSDGYMMKLFLGNVDTIKTLTEAEFVDWLKEKMTSDVAEAGYVEKGDLDTYRFTPN